MTLSTTHPMRVTPVWLGRLRRELRRLALPVLSHSRPGLFSIAFEVPLSELDQPPAAARRWLYWRRPQAGLTLLGLGEAWSVVASGADRFSRLDGEYRRLQSGWTRISHGGARNRARAFLGFAFDPEEREIPIWRGFGNARLQVPELMLEWRDGGCTLTFNWMRQRPVHSDRILTRWLQLLDEVISSSHGDNHKQRYYHQQEQPPASNWQQQVEKAVSAIQRGELQKVVLSRQLQLAFPRPVAHRQMLSDLALHYSACTLLSISFGASVLVAATPERLLSLHHGQVVSDALAGTMASDQWRQDAGMAQHEHQPVVEAIEEALRPLCSRVEAGSKPARLPLRDLSHLYTRVRGQVRPGVNLFQLLGRLHPTPAVGGTPHRQALTWIRQHDGAGRGWYTGAFGWLGDDREGHLSVLLRCALIAGRQARLFAGAGITAVSEPRRELEETRLKFQPMLASLVD